MLLLTGCAEIDNGAEPDASLQDNGQNPADDGGFPAEQADDEGAADMAADPSGDPGAPDAADSSDTDQLVEGPLVINELRAVGDDWIELLNRGTAPLDLSGYQVADADEAGNPRMAEAITFPASVILAPGAYFFIAADLEADAQPGLQSSCVVPEVTSCLHAAWGIGKSGDTIYVFDAAGTLLARTSYPGQGVAEGQTWCRIPDGGDTFGPCTPTPAAANQPVQ
jgi:hypothetical protein